MRWAQLPPDQFPLAPDSGDSEAAQSTSSGCCIPQNLLLHSLHSAKKKANTETVFSVPSNVYVKGGKEIQ